MPAKPDLADAHHLLGDPLRRADQRIGAGAADEPLAVQPIGHRVVRAGEFLLRAHVVVDRRRVLHRHGIVLVVVLGLRLRRPADDMAGGVDADAAPGRRGARCMSAICGAAVVDLDEGGEQEIRRARGEVAARAGEKAAFIVTGRGRCSGRGRPETP